MTVMKSKLLSVVITMLTICIPTKLWSAHTLNPTSVTIAGNLQDELGCPGDWQPDCAATHLAFDANDTIWQGIFNIPAGSYEYKAALNDSWDENYGANAQPNGANIPFNLGAATNVKFYYSHETHWITDNVNSVIATAPGSFQSELGCPGDWQPDCLRSWLQDPDGDGVYEFSTDAIPGGSYEFKVALNEAWDTSFPASNVPFTSNTGDTVTITYDTSDNSVDVTVTTLGDDDSDGVLNGDDLCPDTAPGDPVDAAGCSDAQVDGDGDGVCNDDAVSDGPSACVGIDACPGTVIPEAVPTVKLGTNRWALVDDDFEFDTTAPKGKGPGRSYSTADTDGCSCGQIIAALELGKGHTKHGCSISAMDGWVALPR